MLLAESKHHPPFLDQNMLNPFPTIGQDPSANHIHHTFEDIRANCKYYDMPTADDIAVDPQNVPCKNFTIIHVNARSLLSDEKFAEFELFLIRTKCKWSVICVSESWLCSDMEQRRQLTGYSSFFDNRNGAPGGGVAVYVNNDVIKEATQVPSGITCTQSLFIDCKINNNTTIKVCQIYKPPNLSNSTFIEELGDALNHIQMKNKIAFICGDFNIDLLDISKGGVALEITNILATSGFLPSISKSTRVQNSSHSLIDNIFCNNIALIDKSGILFDDTSDHFPIFVSLDFAVTPKERKQEKQCRFDYHKITDLINHLQLSLENFETITDAETACNTIITAYITGIDKFSYEFRPNRKNTPIKPWISPGILKSISRRCELFNKKQKNPTEENINLYVKYRNMLNKLIRDARHKYIQDQLECCKHDTKKMWEIMLTHTMGKTPEQKYPEYLRNSEGEQIEDDLEVAENFNAFFKTVGKNLQQTMKGAPLDALAFMNDSCKNTIKHLQPTHREELQKIIENMKNVGHGIDKINAKIFKSSCKTILKQLTHLINLCLAQGKFPNKLKIAVVKPVYKTGDKSLVTNYRPISILPYISKVLEKVIHIRIMEHISQNNILNQNQFGFRKGHSTYMPLLILQDRVTKGFESNKISCALYLDLKKAFDTVDHNILLLKLCKYGIKDTALAILKSYLSSRYQCVEYKNVKSSLCEVNIGVPQGSILGPLLFLLYINDFPSISTKFTSLLFADDTALLFEASTASELQSILNTELPKVCEWLYVNKLTLNTSKTNYQIYNKSKTNVDINVVLNGVSINCTNTVKYLGVYIDDDFTWQSHIAHISRIISRNIGIISRSRYFLSCRHRYLLYNALVSPYLNYCCLVWGNSPDSHTEKLQVLQKKIIRILDDQPRLTHTDPIFLKLKILKVKDIARQQSMVVLFNVATQTAPEALSTLFELKRHTQRTPRVTKHFEEIFTRKLYKTRTISWVGPRLWNSIVASRLPDINMIYQLSKKQIKELTRACMLDEYQ